ncbi:MAG: oligosaccharide flippase family protein [Solirubrobacterales bacterium]
MGTAVGTALSAVAAIAFSWRSYRFAFRADVAKAIYRRGRGYMLFMLALFLFHNLDTLLLSRYAPASDVGLLYRVASRIASVPSYFVSARTCSLRSC